MKLEARASAAGVRLVAHEVLGSTNAEALRLARQGECGPLWVVADRQTAGRGRRGRSWISPPGNLYASLLLTAAAPVEHWPELSFVAALAVHDADQLMLMTNKGQSVRIRVSEIRETGRNAQGVRLMNLGEGELVQDVASVVNEDESGVEATPPEETGDAPPEAAE